jgi:hypothetical protein
MATGSDEPNKWLDKVINSGQRGGFLPVVPTLTSYSVGSTNTVANMGMEYSSMGGTNVYYNKLRLDGKGKEKRLDVLQEEKEFAKRPTQSVFPMKSNGESSSANVHIYQSELEYDFLEPPTKEELHSAWEDKYAKEKKLLRSAKPSNILIEAMKFHFSDSYGLGYENVNYDDTEGTLATKPISGYQRYVNDQKIRIGEIINSATKTQRLDVIQKFVKEITSNTKGLEKKVITADLKTLEQIETIEIGHTTTPPTRPLEYYKSDITIRGGGWLSRFFRDENPDELEDASKTYSKGFACSFLIYYNLQGFIFGVFIVALLFVTFMVLWIYFSDCMTDNGRYVTFGTASVIGVICILGAYSFGKEYYTIDPTSYQKKKKLQSEIALKDSEAFRKKGRDGLAKIKAEAEARARER